MKYTAYRTEWQRQKRAREATKSDDKIQCLICGLWYKQVGSHIWQVHKISARQYRKEYGFDVKKGQLPENYRRIKRDYVFENNTVDNLKAGKKCWFKKGDHAIGRYERSQETMERLKVLHKLNRSK